VLRRPLQMIRNLASLLLHPMPSRRARVIQRISDRMNRGTLDLARQTEHLLDAVAQTVDTQERSLLLLCPEWGVIALVQPSSPLGLERTELSLTSPIVQWMQSQDTTVTRWGELVVLPQFQGVSSQERELFERLEAEALISLRVNGSLTGILILGAKRLGDPYRHEELDLLAGVARATARSIENARLYAVERARVAELQSINEMKSEYILTISHQLKTPISAVKASVEMLTELQAESPELRQRLINAIVRGVDSLDRLVTELTEYGKMQSATLELNRVESNLCSIIADTCTLLQPLVDDKKLRMQVDVPPTLPRVVVDPHRVQQILFNLLSNAIKFTPTGGEISIRVGREGEWLLTQVQDNGPGIPAAQQRWVFEAFHAASDSTKGPTGSGPGSGHCQGIDGTSWWYHMGGEPGGQREHLLLCATSQAITQNTAETAMMNAILRFARSGLEPEGTEEVCRTPCNWLPGPGRYSGKEVLCL